MKARFNLRILEKEIKEMVVIVLILLGIVVEIINANAWFIIPDFVSWILFGLAGLGIVFNIINYFVVKKQMKKMNDRFDDLW